MSKRKITLTPKSGPALEVTTDDPAEIRRLEEKPFEPGSRFIHSHSVDADEGANE